MTKAEEAGALVERLKHYLNFNEHDVGPVARQLLRDSKALIEQLQANPANEAHEHERASRPPRTGAVTGEGDTRYNAGVVSALMSELIGPVERERLGKTPWARSLVNDLIRRIANLRAMLSAAPPPPACQDHERDDRLRTALEMLQRELADSKHVMPGTDATVPTWIHPERRTYSGQCRKT